MLSFSLKPKLPYITSTILLLGAISRFVVWRPNISLLESEELSTFLFGYLWLFGSYTMFALATLVTYRCRSFPYVVCIGSAADVTYGLYGDYYHFLTDGDSYPSGSDPIFQAVLAFVFLLIMALRYNLPLISMHLLDESASKPPAPAATSKT